MNVIQRKIILAVNDFIQCMLNFHFGACRMKQSSSVRIKPLYINEAFMLMERHNLYIKIKAK